MSIALTSGAQPTSVVVTNQTDDTRYVGIGTDEGGTIFTANDWTTSQLDEADSFVFQTIDQKKKVKSDLPVKKGTTLFRFLIYKDDKMTTVIGGALYDRALKTQIDTYNATGASFTWAMADNKTLTVKGSYKEVPSSDIWKNPLFWLAVGGGGLIVVGLVIWISIMAAKKKPGVSPMPRRFRLTPVTQPPPAT